jgi:hypothetical protein
MSTGLGDVAGRNADLAAEQRAHLAGDTEQRRGVAAVGRDPELEHALAHRHRVGQRRAHARVGGQHPDPGVVAFGGERELAPRADHPLRHHAAQLRLLDRRAARQRRARQRHRHLLARRHVRGAAHDRARCAIPDVDATHAQTVGVGVRLARVDAADRDRREIGTDPLDHHVLEARHREPVGERALVGKRDELGQPRERESHQT